MKNLTLKELKDSADIIDIVSKHVSLKKNGANFKALCPFHSEKTPSFIVSPDKQIYHCFGCGRGGDVIKFLMEINNVSFNEAVMHLAETMGVSLVDSKERSAGFEERDYLLKIYEIATEFYSNTLTKEMGRIRAYLEKRRLPEKALTDYKIGLSPAGWDSLYRVLKKTSYTDSILVSSGLVKQGPRGCIDLFRNRLMIPIFDIYGRPIAFGGRVLDDSLPKYINSPDSAVYNKSRTLYGLNFAKDHIKKAGSALVVEGYFDAIRMYEFGINNVVASCGTSLTEPQVMLLRRYSDNITILYDSDTAGQDAARRGYEILEKNGVEARLAVLKGAKDPDDYLLKFGREKFEALLAGSVKIFDYELDIACKRNDISSDDGRIKIIRSLLPLVRDEYKRGDPSSWFKIKKLSERLSLDEKTIIMLLEKSSPLPPQKKAPEISGIYNSYEIFIKLLMDNPAYLDTMAEKTSTDVFQDDYRVVIEKMAEVYAREGNLNIKNLIDFFGDNDKISKIFSKISVADIKIAEKDKVFNKIIEDLGRKKHLDSMKAMKGDLKRLNSGGSQDKASEVMQRIYDLKKKLDIK